MASKRIALTLTDELKRHIESMSNETGVSQSQLMIMATHGLVANYHTNGIGMFSSLVRISKDEECEEVSHAEAVKRLRRAGMHDAADELDNHTAKDGTRRGWDEKIERGDLFRKYPAAREVIWPDRYGQLR